MQTEERQTEKIVCNQSLFKMNMRTVPNSVLIAETNQSGQMLAEYIYLGDRVLSMIKPGEAVYYFHNDHLGTPQVMTGDSQAIAWKAVYTPFGEAVPSIQTIENPFRFPGQYYDPETGLHYNYFRYYNPQTGRYLTPDPIGLEGGINLFTYVDSVGKPFFETNLYTYTGNNPVNRIDPWGLIWSGAGVTVLGQILSGGGTAGLYRIQNWSTGEQCIIAVYGGGLGGGLGGSINAESIWIWNAPTSADLGGTVNAVVAYAGWGATGVGGGYGKGGCSKDIVSRNDIPNPSKSSSVNFGAGLGGGAGYIVGSFTTKVLFCW